MRQAAGAVLRRGWKSAGASSSALRSLPGAMRIGDSSRKQWLACNLSSPMPPSRSPLLPFHAARFSSAAVNSSKGGSSEEEKSPEPVCQSGKDEKKGGAKAGDGKATGVEGGGEKKQGEKPAAEEKKVETAEQKLLKEIKKLEQQVREKESIIEEKDDIAKELKDNVLRAYAELENYRERAKREQESSRKFAIQSFSKDLLDVSDNLSRALSSIGQPEEAKKTLETLLEGVKMTEKQLSQVLKKYGVERFDPTGEPFDPNVHLAVCEVADPSKPAGTVASVFKVGYLLHERVLRPAEVAVVKAAEAAA